MPDPLDQLERLAPFVDREAALAAFASERVRRRRRRHALLSVAAVVLVALVGVPTFIAASGQGGETTLATGGDGDADESPSTSPPIDAASLDFEVLAVLEQTGQEMGTIDAALDAGSYSHLWTSFGDQPPAPDFVDSSFVLAITIPDDACPPTLERFVAPENAFVPVFVEPDVGCEEPLVPKTFVVAVGREGLPGTVVFRLPADDVYDLPAFGLAINLEAETIDREVTSTTVPAPDEAELPGEPVDTYPYEGAELAAVGLADGELLAVHEFPTDGSDVVAELLWSDTDIVATGRNRRVDDRMWTELTFQGVTGWAPFESLLQPLASKDEIIDELFPDPSDLPTASNTGALALMVVNAFGQEPYTRVATFDHPEDSTAAGSLRIDIIGLGDDATGGVRLRITARSRSGDLVLTSVERTELCRRGASDGGCV